MNDFDFVTDKAVRTNIDQANELVLELYFLTNSQGYKEKPILVSSLRKTIIIYTASIIEALLLWQLKALCHTGSITLQDEWEYKDPHLIVGLENDNEIVWIFRRKVKKKLDKIDFVHLIKICTNKSILTGKKLIRDVDEVRKLRNNLHISGLTVVEREYTEKDLAFCFSTVEKVKKLLSKRNTRKRVD